jgi:hypothetical protein
VVDLISETGSDTSRDFRDPAFRISAENPECKQAIAEFVLNARALLTYWHTRCCLYRWEAEPPGNKLVSRVRLRFAEGLFVKTLRSIRDFFTGLLGRVGVSSGEERGPKPGEGAVIHHSSGEADFDGFPGDVPPPIKDAERDLPYPTKRTAD